MKNQDRQSTLNQETGTYLNKILERVGSNSNLHKDFLTEWITLKAYLNMILRNLALQVQNLIKEMRMTDIGNKTLIQKNNGFHKKTL